MNRSLQRFIEISKETQTLQNTLTKAQNRTKNEQKKLDLFLRNYLQSIQVSEDDSCSKNELKVTSHQRNSQKGLENMTLNDDDVWMSWDDFEIAKQFCLIEFEIYQNIAPMEFINLNWSKHKHLAPNILSFIAHFNNVNT
jgi:hypothetical protein